MKYSHLAQVYQQLESTSKRLEKTHIIAELLKKTSAEEIGEITLLLQGRVFPSYDESKLGLASKLVIKAINTATGINLDKIQDEWRKTGDLGKVAENLVSKKKQATLMSTDLTVSKYPGLSFFFNFLNDLLTKSRSVIFPITSGII